MTFEDLPSDWDKQPLTDPHIAMDAVDLFLGDNDRNLNAMLVLMCGHDLVPLQPLIVDGVDWRCSAAERRRAMSFLTHLPIGGVVIGISAPHPIPFDVAQRWHRAAAEACAPDDAPELMHFCSATAYAQPHHMGELAPKRMAS